MWKRSVLITISLVGIVSAFIIFDKTFGEPEEDICKKVWAHRAYHGDWAPNSPVVFEKAAMMGASGIELDIFYDDSLGAFVVSHDLPYERRDGSVLFLGSVFSSLSYNSELNFWLDFKNLRLLNAESTAKSVDVLSTLTRRWKVRNRIIVESTDVDNLKQYSDAGFVTSYWVVLSFDKMLSVVRQSYYFHSNDFDYISMDYRDFGLGAKILFPFAKVNLFTVNELSEVRRLASMKNVEIILSDKPFYAERPCVN